MKSKGAVKLFSIALTLVCLFQLSFTLVINRVENKAKDFANGDPLKERAYLDSISHLGVYNLGFKKYTYLECKERELNLGLDLQGGMNVTLEVSLGDLISSLSNHNPDVKFNQAIALTNEKIKSSTKDYVTLFGESYSELEPAGKLAAIFANQSNKDKIKINSSNDEVIKYIREEAEQAIDRSFQILRARIDKFGVAQPNIQKLQGSGRILVELPGVDNPTRVRKLLQGTAKLEFYETFDNSEGIKYLFDINTVLKKSLELDNDKKDSNAVSTDTTTTESSALANIGNKNVPATVADSTKKDSTNLDDKNNPLFDVIRPYINEKGELLGRGSVVGVARISDTSKVNTFLQTEAARSVTPPNLKFLWEQKAAGDNKDMVLLHAVRLSRNGTAALEGDKIINATRDVSQSGEIQVDMTMNAEGAKIWRNLTKANVGHSVAIVLDDIVYSSPNVQNEIPNGRSNITGGFTSEEAGDLANILKAGKLPAPTKIVGEAIVGPTLGAEAITSGLWSFVIALIVVLAFMGFYYNSAGWVADIALFANVFFVVGVLASLGAVLTLPGIAGVVLTIGMSVDANILIFERVREEMHHNAKSTRNAISEGFSHAMSSILDSNITTLLLGVILYAFGTGPVQGFATTLIIGILTSLFSAIFITRLIFEWQLNRDHVITFWRKSTEHVFDHIKIDFVGRRKMYYTISGIIIAIGIGFYFINGGFNMGVDFKGGRTYVMRFDREMNADEIREALHPAFGSAPEVKTYGNKSQYKITTSYLIDDASDDAESKVEEALINGLKPFNVTKANILTSQKVGETISADIKTKAIWSVILSCIVMFVYILIRFKKWQYGLGAVTALVHDVLVVLSCFLIFENIVPFTLEIDQHFIAAILTVMGYSMTDTVVVFDRIREYLTVRNQSELGRGERNTVINYALNSTLSRTINTSLTIFFVLLAIFIFGGETIKGFSFALLIGIVIGTYSSICIATPVVIDFDKKEKDVPVTA